MNTKSKVLALKYRPVVFNDVIGQDVVCETIYNSIKENKIPNAYLFTGIRGVGKTTFARIVAKALNCKNTIEKLCKEKLCESCASISVSNHIDVLEMDAASKTSVDDVRELLEISRYGPSTSKYKIFIIDEVHMLSKQAFNALLKTLEEPPQYENGGSLKFIFATTEIKKIPITVLSRCQRYDLSRIKSETLFSFLKNIHNLEEGNMSDDALKLIVKISEGSVRDSLSLLDRALLSNNKQNKMELSEAQKIFGYFDKAYLIKIFGYLFEGDDTNTLQIYRTIYNSGVEPKIFLNDFLEVLYYIKNINSFSENSSNFNLNNEEFNNIKNLSNKVENETLILFWQFTISTFQELDVVADQNISIEMFLIRLLHLKSIKPHKTIEKKEMVKGKNNPQADNFVKKDSVNQIKNITQEKNLNEIKIKNIKKNDLKIESLDDLIELSYKKKELKLKYDLENNVNLVNFENGKIEISFNDKLEKDLVKILSSKLLEWTNKRWIISFSKELGDKSKKAHEADKLKKLFEEAKKTETYRKILENFSDAELVQIDKKDE